MEPTATLSFLELLRVLAMAVAGEIFTVVAVAPPVAALQFTTRGLVEGYPALMDRKVFVGAARVIVMVLETVDVVGVVPEELPEGVKVMVTEPAARQPAGSVKVQLTGVVVELTAELLGAPTVRALAGTCVTVTVGALVPVPKTTPTVMVLEVVEAPTLHVRVLLPATVATNGLAACNAPAPIVSASSTRRILKR